MSLFERLNNKRYDLQEAIDDKGNITPEPGDIAKEKSILRNIKKKQVRLDKNQKKIINTNTKAGDKLLQDINKKLSASTTKGDQARALYGTEGGSTEGAGGAGETFKVKNTDKTLSTKQIDTSKVNARSAEILKINNKKPIKGGKTVNPVTAYDYKNVVKPDKFKDVVKKFQGSYKDINKIKKIPASEVKPVVPKKDPSFKISGTTSKTTPPSKPTFTKTDNPTFKDFKKRGISFDIKKSPTTVVNPVNLSKGPSLPNFVGRTSKGNVVTQSTSSALPSGGKEPKLPNLPKNKPNFSHASLKNLKRLGLKYVSIEKNTESAKK